MEQEERRKGLEEGDGEGGGGRGMKILTRKTQKANIIVLPMILTNKRHFPRCHLSKESN